MIGAQLQIMALVTQLLVFVIAVFLAARNRKTLLLVGFLLPTLLFSWKSFAYLSAMANSVFGHNTFALLEPVLLVSVTVLAPAGCSYVLIRQHR